ncbi:hypothetical protein AMECASPLE_026568, partial [Ameca splendens]
AQQVGNVSQDVYGKGSKVQFGFPVTSAFTPQRDFCLEECKSLLGFQSAWLLPVYQHGGARLLSRDGTDLLLWSDESLKGGQGGAE